MIRRLLVLFAFVCINQINAAEIKWHGVVDIRATTADTLNSYVEGGYGKFGVNDGTSLSVAQAGLAASVAWDSGVSGHIVANGYLDEVDSNIGLTEGFLKYRSLPNEQGYRWQAKAGIFYPDISLENNALAWASKHTLNSSSLNNWIGEEIRVLGAQAAVTRLGKFHGQPFDISASLTIFANNDPAGALLSWHGWSIGNRQTLWTESRPLPLFKARVPGNSLAGQAAESDPFLELDDKVGTHSNAKILFRGKGTISAGYYDNNGRPFEVKNGQYAWRTRFWHWGIQWRLPMGLELTSQYLTGDTLMQNPMRQDMVNNDYASGFVAISKRIKQHRATVRLEEFSVTDKDTTYGDNNEEYGKAATVNYTYKYSKPWLLSAEYTWVNSTRPAREYVGQDVRLIERQFQVAARYFF